MRGYDFSYLRVLVSSKDGNNIFFRGSKFFPLSFSCSTQNVFIGYVGDLSNIRWKSLYLEASNDASERGVIFIYRDKGAIESKN